METMKEWPSSRLHPVLRVLLYGPCLLTTQELTLYDFIFLIRPEGDISSHRATVLSKFRGAESFTPLHSDFSNMEPQHDQWEWPG